MKLIALAASAALLALGSAQAGEVVRAPSAEAAAKDAAARESVRASRVVYICDRSDMTLRGFAREFGEVKFVSAEKALNSQEGWAAPRCISETEASRLAALMSR